MNILFHIFMLTAIYASSRKTVYSKNITRSNSQSKSSREAEAYTSILLDDEAFSIEPVESKPIKHSNLQLLRQNLNRKNHTRNTVLKSGAKVSKENPNIDPQTPHIRVKPVLSMTLAKNTATGITKGIHSGKNHINQHNHRKHKKRTNMFKKRLHKKRFIRQKNNFNNIRDSTRSKHRQDDNIGPSHLFALAPVSSTRKTIEYSKSQFKTSYFQFSSTPFVKKQPFVTEDSDKADSEDFSDKTTEENTEETEDSALYRRENKITLNQQYENYATASWLEPNFQPKDSQYHIPNQHISDNIWKQKQPPRPYRENNNSTPARNYKNYDRTSTSMAMTPTASKFYEMKFDQADIIQRSPMSSTKHPKTEQEKIEDQLRTDESDADDTVVGFDVACDQVVNQTCWVEREVGDVLTLAVKIESSKKPSAFQIRWIRMYHRFNSEKSHPVEILPGKLPWNMVSGSEGRELRLNPVTNTDIDPNCIEAKVFLVTKHHGKTLFTELKKLVFRIDIPITDMGKIYAGEELSINIENFISLPERGNMIFDWSLETKPHHIQSLPSNAKISNSGRSMVLKELKKGHLGVLNCVVYSSSRIAVAKRRFNILKIADSVKRRSSGTNFYAANSGEDLKPSLTCRRIIRRSHEKALKRLEDGISKPKSRKKRFKRMESNVYRQSELECGQLKKKLYSRWVRSLFSDFTTEDTKVMSIEKLFELSEDGDGTLDNVIPHEVHYVEPLVKYVAGTARERSVNQIVNSWNCTTDTDCGQDADCVMNEEQKNFLMPSGNCFCRPEFYGDGHTCQKIPDSYHREKRLRRHLEHTDKRLSIPEHLFYEHPKGKAEVPTPEPQDDETLETPSSKVLAFEEEESFLISNCIDDKDCSIHANCVQPTNGHPYCKCRPGFRGNGIFCWEIIDYVPPEEQFLPDEDIEPGRPTVSEEGSIGRLASKIPTSEELEED